MGNREKVKTEIKEWARKHLGPEFSFREHQVETICDIIMNILNKEHHTHVIEAPTGSGKSLLCIASAGVLSQYYKIKSFILCSDLYLFSQYEDFIKKYHLDYGALKGQTGNYYCDINGEDMRNAECRIANVSWSKIIGDHADDRDVLGFNCAKYCTYVQARYKALMSNVTVMTYQLYFYMINVVAETAKTPVFRRRGVIFCDECHNIPSLIQQHYSINVCESDVEQLGAIWKYTTQNTDLFSEKTALPYKTLKELERTFYKYWSVFKSEDENADYEGICNYAKFIDGFLDAVNAMELELSERKWKRRSKKSPKRDIEQYKLTSWYKNYCCHLHDFQTAITESGPAYLVKKHNFPTNDEAEFSVSFSCAKEDYMCWKYLLNTAPNNVLLSATVGMHESFDSNIGVRFGKDHKSFLQRIPSTFDFSNSPVFINSEYKMSYKTKDTAFPKIQNLTYTIIRKYKGFRGIIQTGSYANTKEIYTNAPADIKKRLKLYNMSKEKDWAIEEHKTNNDDVLIGPTLLEGIDLPGDLCRFIIIAKVPYPNLSDKLVKAKMRLFPMWYNSETANHIIQGIGRGNRFPQDWCVTYILDGCFNFLYMNTKKQFPPELQDRFKHIKAI